MNPHDTGLFSNVRLGPMWFPSRKRTPLQEGWYTMYDSLQKTFFKDVGKPYAVYMFVDRIKYLEDPKCIASPSTIEKINKRGLKIYLYEPLTTYIVGVDSSKPYIEYEDSDGLDIRSRELDSIHLYVERNGLQGVEVYTPNYNVREAFQHKYPLFDLFCTPVGWVYPSTMKLNLDFPDSENITKRFWCGNWRYASNRHAVSSFLVDNFEKSDYNLSWPYNSSDEILRKKLWFEIEQSKHSESLIKGSNKLGKLSPLNIDLDIKETLSIENYHKNTHFNHNPKESYNECFCAIVNETRFAEPTAFITEKIMNAMVNCKPFIIVGGPSTLEYMKQLGFETFDNWFDESYDKETCHYKRLDKIFDLMLWIKSLSIEDLRSMYDDMTAVLFYNQQHILNLQEELLAEPITKSKLFRKVQ